MTVVTSWTCPTCRTAVATSFCSACGEKPLSPGDLTLRGLFGLVFKAFSNIDGRLLRSFRDLVTRPGALTAAFVKGQRKPYIGPFPLFLIANALFFASQSLTGMRIFSAPLDRQLHNLPWSDFSQDLVARHLAATGRAYDLYAPLFDQAIAVNAKSLIGLMVPLLAVLTPLILRTSARPFAVHVVFSLHFHAFLLLLLCVPLLVAAVDGWTGGTAVLSPQADDVASVMLISACAIYLHLAVGSAFEVRGMSRVVRTALLTIAVAAVFMAYRFLLLPITLYTT